MYQLVRIRPIAGLQSERQKGRGLFQEGNRCVRMRSARQTDGGSRKYSKLTVVKFLRHSIDT